MDVNVQLRHDGSNRINPTETYFGTVDQLRRIIAGLGLSSPDADDILQQVYLKATREPADFGESQEAYRWLVRVTVNECLLEFRRRRRFRRAAKEILQRRSAAPEPEEPRDRAIRTEEVDMVREAMKDLGESIIVPLALRYFSGLDSTEIGRILELPASTVRRRLHEGRLILAKRLRNRGMEA